MTNRRNTGNTGLDVNKRTPGRGDKPKTARALMLATVLSVILVGLNASAGGLVTIVHNDTLTRSDTSGHGKPLDQREKHVASDITVGLHGLEVIETSDNPAEIKLHYEHFAGSSGTVAAESLKISPFPNPIAGTTQRRTAEFADPDVFVGAIEVCTNNKSNQRIKNFKIYGREVDQHGNVSPAGITLTASSVAPNCKTWHDKVTCPIGYIAVGAVGHYTDKGFTGMALKCMEVGL